MRNIKFRMWDKQLQRMYYPGDKLTDTIVIGYSEKGDINSFHIGEGHEEWEVIGGAWRIERENVCSEPMQFTGLIDKNGLEIYEGDIVKLTYIDGQSETFTVTWRLDEARYYLIDANGETWGFTAKNDMEIIGNVFQTPLSYDK